ncbi:uncharacterized protein [Glycine max]|uniref:uncharacterized protein n=1 Tax=Glycine max TaxID=3847 RepID=UPI0003DE8116|nr:uncharacterized protein LOC102667136 [Glycine max]|eukprot:XP_006593206.1 uncharacterized protein LOC102667136 [Glycine max]
MNFTKRNTQKYNFKDPDLTNLRKLGSLVVSPDDFRKRYGNLLSILKTNVEEGILNTLVQFYDPLYHCFTFPDYQLVPTLEEYSYLVGLPVSDKLPFSGLEPTPKPLTIAAALHLKTSDITSNLTTKGGFQGLTPSFLYQKAYTFAEATSTGAFEATLALLIYGLILFPNIDDFIDINTIQIFISGNPVPTLLADTYHSIHHRTQKKCGVITCCAPLLYKWFTLHLPQTHLFKTNPEKTRWPQRIMSLTPIDILWYQPASNIGVIIDSCGEFPNVPLISTRGGITYNPTLARRQFGYPMKEKPNNLSLTGEFYLNHEDHAGMRLRFVRAWHTVRRLDRNQLGRRTGFVHGSYTQWVIDRASILGLPYPLPRHVSSTVPSPSLPVPFDNKEECNEQLIQMRLERDTWKKKYQELERENETLKGKLAQKDHELFVQNQRIIEKDDLLRRKDALLRQDSKRRRRFMDSLSSAHPDFEDPSTPGV